MFSGMVFKASFTLILLVLFSSSLALASGRGSCFCSEEPASHSLNHLLVCFEDERCEDDKLDLEVSIRFKARSLVDATKDYLRLSNNPLIPEEERLRYGVFIKESKRLLRQVKRVTPFEGNNELVEPLFIDFDYPDRGYHRYYNVFNIGFEYVSLERLSESGFPRLGVFFYRRFGQAPVSQDGFAFYGVHTKFSLQLTSAASLGETSLNGGLNHTLDAGGELFFPFYHSVITLDQTLGDYVGPVFKYDIEKKNNSDQADQRVYVGIRNAINPEVYFDISFGQTGLERLSRMEIRGQLPVYKFAQGTRVFFGAIVNTQAPWISGSQGKDVIRFYLDWNANFERIFRGLSAAVGL